MCPWYSIKPSDGEAPALGNVQYSFTALALGPHWPGVVAPDRILSKGPIEQTV